MTMSKRTMSGRTSLRLLERLLATVGGDDAEALLGQRDGHELRDARFVVRDENQWLRRHRASCSTTMCIELACDGDASAALLGSIVGIRACRAFTADIAEPLSAHYNASGPGSGIPCVPMLDIPVRGRADRGSESPRNSP